MHDALATPSVARRSSSIVTALSVAGLVLLSSGCAGDGPVAATAPRGPEIGLMAAARGASDTRPAACASDSKLIGLISLSTADEPGTWWYLTRTGLDAAGVTDYVARMEMWFGRDFADLDEAVAFLVAQVVPADANGNGYVCAYSTRGARMNIGDPDLLFYYFRVRDDKHGAL